jgi:hypothetical protein
VTDDQTQSYEPRPAGQGETGGAGTSGTSPAGSPPGDRPLGLRGGLHRLSSGLIAYGAIGLVVCIIGLGALVWVNGRIDSLAARVSTSVDEMATILERTAVALDDASATAESFTVTIDKTAEGVNAAADAIAGVRTSLETLEGVLRAVNILGVTPLGPAADAVGAIANGIEGLDTRLSAIGDSLEGNSDALAANATSLERLADSTAAAAERLRSGVIEASLDDIHAVLIVVLLVLTGWTAVPAIGALVFGVWLRRELARAP